MERAIGISTGVLHESISPVSWEIFKIHKAVGCTAVEIGCTRKEKLIGLSALDGEGIRSNFVHLSLHAPTNMKYGRNCETERALEMICKEHKRFQFDLVVIHPESVDDWEVLENFPFSIGIENADCRKDFGKTVEDLEKVFGRICAGFVLDVNHCYTNDKTMELAKEFVNHFPDRLREIHLSGFTRYHEPIHLTRQIEILGAVPSGNTPIIIESVCVDENEARREFEFVRKYFNS